MLLFLCGVGRAQLPDVTETALSDLGNTYGTPQMNGFVFIEGRYIPPPYTVTRKGNGIFVNRIQVEQPVIWPRPQPGTAGNAADTSKKSVDADGDFEKVDQPAAKPAAGADKKAKSIDDLFSDDDDAKPAPAKPAAAPAPKTPAAEPLVQPSPEDLEREKQRAVVLLDRYRSSYEQALSRGDLFFFSQRHNRVNGNYGTARTLFKVLPAAMRYAESPSDLWQRLTQGGVYFLDLGICAELYRNKVTFLQLEDRQRKIEEAEALEAARRNKPTSVW